MQRCLTIPNSIQAVVCTYVPLPGSSDGNPASESRDDDLKIDDLVYPPPFGPHPNLLACGIGLMTFLTLWIMFPSASPHVKAGLVCIFVLVLTYAMTLSSKSSVR